MQLSTRGRYAVMAMVDLASREANARGGGPVCLAEIATRQQLSQSYLEQLFAKLRRAKLVCSVRGPGGGYHLGRPADTIAIAEIVTAVDEPLKATRCVTGSGGCLAAPAFASEALGFNKPGCSDAPPRLPVRTPVGTPIGTPIGTQCQTHDLWLELGRQIGFFLSGITLADVVGGHIDGRAVCLPAHTPALPEHRPRQAAGYRRDAG